MSAETTYSGTEPPPQGQSAFAEPGRAPLFGREAETAALANLVMGRGFRAGLLYGEPGVGKTTTVRAGLVPLLAQQEVVALCCDDILRPVESLASSMSALTGIQPDDGEPPLLYLDRVVARALADRQFVFVLDDADRALATGDELVVALGDLFARIVTRSGGRARFLFCCASARVHLFGALEQRTGSLFPPSSRYELRRFEPGRAVAVLEHILAQVHPAADPALARGLVEALAEDSAGAGSSGILASDLALMALAVRELGITGPAALYQLGSPPQIKEQLERAWVEAAASATGQQRAALRLLAELVAAPVGEARSPAWMAARVGIDPGFALHALSVFQAKGLVHVIPGPESFEPRYALTHPSLLPRVRQVADPALAAARRWREALAAKAESGKPLTPLDFWALRTEHIVPATSQERAIIERSKRLYTIAGAAIVAAPLLFLLLIYIAMAGRSYLDVAAAPGGGTPRLVVRAGRPGLSAFDWLPGDFGSIIADTGFSRPMVKPKAWQQAAEHDITGDDDAYASAALAALDPGFSALIDYATAGGLQALDALRADADTGRDPQGMIALLESLAPIARGGAEEVSLIEQALNDASPAVQASALAVAAQAAQRTPGLYHETLARALTAENAELRRLAFAAVRALGDQTAPALFQAALAENPGDEARLELLAEVTSQDTGPTPSPAAAASILVNRDIPLRIRQKARSELKRAFSADAKAASLAAARLASDAKAPPEDQVYALGLLRDLAPPDTYAELAAEVKTSLASPDESVRAAALPVYARIAPRDAAGELAVLLQGAAQSEPLRVAMALAWGEVAKTKERAAAVALETLLDDESPRVRAAAAEAYGNVGRAAQEELIKLIKTARIDVAEGAAFGLANSIEVGAPMDTALGGIGQMWRRKGRTRRSAGEVFARLARTKPRQVHGYLLTAVRDASDEVLRAIGTQGLCRASVAGHDSSQRALVKSSLDTDVEVRRVVVQCVADAPFDPGIVATIAVRLSHDGDAGIRADSARALLHVVGEGAVAEPVAQAVTRLVADRERSVRVLAARVLAKMGTRAPQAAAKALVKAYESADEDEKLLLLQTARAIGAGDLVPMAAIDESLAVRGAALDTAIETGTNVAATLSAALTDSNAEVRRAALVRLASGKDKLDPDAVQKSLSLALRDPDVSIARLALITLVQLGEAGEVKERVRALLGDRSEHRRVQAAAACIGLVGRDPAAVVELLEPLLDDPSHDVRVAMLPALAAAYAATLAPDKLASRLRGSEEHAMRRLVATAAFLALARTDAGREAAVKGLSDVAKNGPALVQVHAKLGLGLIESSADGIAFVERLVP